MVWTALHVHSQYSILNSAASVSQIVESAKACGMKAVAITDEGNLYGAVDFTKACLKEGIKPIIGCELALAPGSRHEKKRTPGIPYGYPVILLAKNQTGYRNLCILSSKAFLEGFYYTPRIDKELLKEHSEGLICLSGGLRGSIAKAIVSEDEKFLNEEIDFFHSLFGEDFYFEVQRHTMSDEAIRADGLTTETWLHQNYLEYIRAQETVINKIRKLSKERKIKCVATNDTHYIHRDDWKAHEIMMNIQSGETRLIWERDSFGNLKERVLNPKRKTMPTHELDFKTPEEMASRFEDFPEALETTTEIVDKCHVELDFKSRFYPVYIPDEMVGTDYTEETRSKAAEAYLVKLCEEGIERRYTEETLAKVQEVHPGKDPMQVVRDRLKYELELIISKGMGDYLLIVYDFIHWAKNRDIPVGPGRGSGAGSIILYLIGITDIEPLRFSLFFERFINPERLSYPDIDVDICMERRGEVIDYTVQKYGHDKVAQIITFGTMKAKMAVKDVGRVLNVPLTKVNQIAKLIPDDLNMTLEKALEIDPDLQQLYKEDEEVNELINFAKRLEGSVRNTGIHAAGLIICGDPLTDHIPICNAKDSDIAATQFSMKPVESVGMLKVDFLGLKTLTSIQKAVKAVEKKENTSIDWVNLPLDDTKTYDLLNHGKTLGIFQLESGGMQELAKQLHIDRFEEIIAVGALYRPGPMDMIPSFINRKHGREEIEIDHPQMADILKETYGIMVYQEQVMQMASLLAGYSLGEGDVLRRAMGKKDLAEMQRQREKFKNGAAENGISEELSMLIFDKVEKFASYGFNKSHAAAYGYLTYVTAYLKANYPYEWMAALMTCDRDDLTKVAKVIRECQAMHIPILSPDVNESGNEFVATDKGVRFALSAIKGVGAGIVDTIIEEREKNGKFESLFEFFKRVDTKKVGKRVVEYLIEAGAFDFTGWTRQEMVLSVEPMYSEAGKQQKENAKGILNFLDMIEDEQQAFDTPPKVEEEVPKAHLLRREKELLGFFLTGHPMDEHRRLLKQLSCVPFSEIENLDANAVFRCAFIVESIQVRIASRSQKKFAILVVSDGMERFELPIWPDLYEEKSHILAENQLLYAVVQKEMREGTMRYQCRWYDDLTQSSQAMIAECDAAFEKAKHHAKLAEFKNKQQGEGKKKKVEKKEEKKPPVSQSVSVKVDADRARLSQILKIKEYIHDHSGDSKVTFDFQAGNTSVGRVEVDGSWGVDPTSDFKKKIEAIDSVQEVTFESS